MISRCVVPVICLLLLAGCGAEEPPSGPMAELAGLWRPADDDTRDVVSMVGFVLLGADGRFEQFDGSVVAHGTFRLDGESIVFEPETKEPAPTVRYALDGDRLTLRVGEGERGRELRLARADQDELLAGAPARFHTMTAALAPEIRTRVTRAAQERIVKLDLDEVFEISSETKADVKRTLATLFIPWNARMPSGTERIDGQFVLQFTYAGEFWRLLQVQMVIPQGPQASANTIVRRHADDGVDINPAVDIAQAFWDAWVEYTKRR